MSELVGDDDLELRPRRFREQRVEQDDTARAPDPRHVGVVLARATARVGNEHVANRNAGTTRERTQAVSELDVLERLKAVEDRLEQKRRRKHE
jgi:hypothetical protein